MQKDELLKLLIRYNNGRCTESEKAFIEDWYLQHETNTLDDISAEQREYELEEIWGKLPIHKNIGGKAILWRRIAVAAIALLVVGSGVFFIRQTHQNSNLRIAKEDVLPGGNKAVLKLANGQSIILTDTAIGKISGNQGVVVNKSQGGMLQYLANSIIHKFQKIVYDTLYTPIGGTFKLKLSDGTNVQLNAESALRYPETFSGNERTVELLKGEGYFEVIHDKNKPFRVITGRQVTEDIGTRFNINAYGNKVSVQTTLIEGSVKVSGIGGKEQRLSVPGQQGNFSVSNSDFFVKNVDMDNIIAWTDGMFLFDDTNLTDVMDQLSRWYNVKIIYRGIKPVESFTGEARRSAKLSVVLKMLQTTGNAKFEINKGNIIVETKYSSKPDNMAK